MADLRRLLDDPSGSALGRQLLASAQHDRPSQARRARVARRLGIAAVIAAGTSAGSEAGAVAAVWKLAAVVLALGGTVGLAIWRSPSEPAPPPAQVVPTQHVAGPAAGLSGLRLPARQADERTAPDTMPAAATRHGDQSDAAAPATGALPPRHADLPAHSADPADEPSHRPPASATVPPQRRAAAVTSAPAAPPAPPDEAEAASDSAAPAGEPAAPPAPAVPDPAPAASAADSPAVAPAPEAIPPPTPAQAPIASRLAAEVALVDHARDALRSGDRAAALAALAAYHQQFAPGDLDAEADLVMLETLIAQHDSARARQLATAFLARFPRSPLAQRVHSLLDRLPK